MTPTAQVKELTLTRTFDAPRAAVWKAWTDPKALAKWWGPRGFTNPVCEWDARPGGKIRVHMKGPDGTVYPMGGEVREVVPPEKLVFTATAFFDDAGNPGLENLNTVTLAEKAGKTTLTLRVVVLKALPIAAQGLAGMKEGWSQSLEKLGELIA